MSWSGWTLTGLQCCRASFSENIWTIELVCTSAKCARQLNLQASTRAITNQSPELILDRIFDPHEACEASVSGQLQQRHMKGSCHQLELIKPAAGHQIAAHIMSFQLTFLVLVQSILALAWKVA